MLHDMHATSGSPPSDVMHLGILGAQVGGLCLAAYDDNNSFSFDLLRAEPEFERPLEARISTAYKCVWQLLPIAALHLLPYKEYTRTLLRLLEGTHGAIFSADLGCH